jgi:hypothetical protein|tara:strand:- start:1870 stop:2274 length:405 start_codon:yes stop_codon:yes gene_type:complete
LNKADRDLFLYGLSTGDLVQLHSATVKKSKDAYLDLNPTKVIVGSNLHDATEHWLSKGWLFKFLDSGTLGIYVCRVPQGALTKYWAHFHKVYCDGTPCIVHEKYLYPYDWVYDPDVHMPPEPKNIYLSYTGSML